MLKQIVFIYLMVFLFIFMGCSKNNNISSPSENKITKTNSTQTKIKKENRIKKQGFSEKNLNLSYESQIPEKKIKKENNFIDADKMREEEFLKKHPEAKTK